MVCFQAFTHSHIKRMTKIYTMQRTERGREYHLKSWCYQSEDDILYLLAFQPRLHLSFPTRCLRAEINSSNDDAQFTCTTSAFDHIQHSHILHTKIFNLNIIRVGKNTWTPLINRDSIVASWFFSPLFPPEFLLCNAFLENGVIIPRKMRDKSKTFRVHLRNSS